MLVKCPDNKPEGIRVNSNGVTIHVYPGPARRVPPHLVTAAGSAGCYVLPEEDETQAEVNAVAPASTTETEDDPDIELNLGGEYEPTARHEEIVAAIDTLMAAGDESAFTKSNRPRKSSVVALTNFDVSIEEINAAMDEVASR